MNHLDVSRVLEGSSQLLFFWGETQGCSGATIGELCESVSVAMYSKLLFESGIMQI